MTTSHIRAVFEHGKLRLLDPVDLEEGQQVGIAILKEEKAVEKPDGVLSARDLLKLPQEERNRLLAEAAARAEEDYRTDSNLIAPWDN